MSRSTIAVVGASSDQRKFGNKCVRAYKLHGYDVYPVSPDEPTIEGLPAYRTLAEVPVAELDRVSIYLPPDALLQVLPELAKKAAKQVWFNPGSSSAAVLEKARSLGMNAIAGCSIVDLGSHSRSSGAG